MGRWGDGEMGRWGDGEVGRWGDKEDKEELPITNSPLPIPHYQFSTSALK
ncbi:MAG: hypothetical protein KME31_15785 [Tolypothrix carrinoi HA7290-LM1]|nr:hypothetical protein [Tolypothrix carrinoi HA7290-LM1]